MELTKQQIDQNLVLQLRTVHQNYLAIGETKALLKNIKKQRDMIVGQALTESILKNKSDSEIRCLCAQAKGIKDVLDFIINKYESIT
jgi:hypothetical protein